MLFKLIICNQKLATASLVDLNGKFEIIDYFSYYYDIIDIMRSVSPILNVIKIITIVCHSV